MYDNVYTLSSYMCVHVQCTCMQMQSVPAPMPSPVISSSVSGGYGLMRIDSDSELEAVSEIEEVDIQDDDGKYGRGGVGQKVKRFLFHQPVSRREGSREPSQQPEINELYEKIEGIVIIMYMRDEVYYMYMYVLYCSTCTIDFAFRIFCMCTYIVHVRIECCDFEWYGVVKLASICVWYRVVKHYL